MAYTTVKERRLQERKEFREYIKLSDDKVLDTKKNNIELDEEKILNPEINIKIGISQESDHLKIIAKRPSSVLFSKQ